MTKSIPTPTYTHVNERYHLWLLVIYSLLFFWIANPCKGHEEGVEPLMANSRVHN